MKQQAAQRVRSGEGTPPPERDYVFGGPQGGLLNVNYVRDRVWYPALEPAKLRARTIYQTRHTFASNALAAGEDPQWVARMLGHKSVQILYRVYARWIVNRTHQDGRALAGRLKSLSVTPGEEVLTDRPGGRKHRGLDADETRTIASAPRRGRADLRDVSQGSVELREVGAEGGI